MEVDKAGIDWDMNTAVPEYFGILSAKRLEIGEKCN